MFLTTVKKVKKLVLNWAKRIWKYMITWKKYKMKQETILAEIILIYIIFYKFLKNFNFNIKILLKIKIFCRRHLVLIKNIWKITKNNRINKMIKMIKILLFKMTSKAKISNVKTKRIYKTKILFKRVIMIQICKKVKVKEQLYNN